MSKQKQKLVSEPHSITAVPSLPKFVMVVHGSYYSYKTARSCSEPRSVERRLSFAIEVTEASGNWKHPVPLKIIISARFQWLLFHKLLTFNSAYMT